MLVQHITSASPNANGEIVNVEDAVTLANGTPATATVQYEVNTDGTIKINLGTAQAGGGQATFSGSGTLFIPNATQVPSCSPCTFTANTTGTITGLPEPLNATVTETATSAGSQNATVPAGSFSAQKIHIVLNMSGGIGGTTSILQGTVVYDIYLAENVGIVEISGGTVTETVAGRTFSVQSGDQVLVSYVP